MDPIETLRRIRDARDTLAAGGTVEGYDPNVQNFDDWAADLADAALKPAEPEAPHVFCSQCGGTNVQYQTWVDPNKDTVVGDDGRTWREMRNAGLSWCADCDDHTLLTFDPTEDEGG